MLSLLTDQRSGHKAPAKGHEASPQAHVPDAVTCKVLGHASCSSAPWFLRSTDAQRRDRWTSRRTDRQTGGRTETWTGLTWVRHRCVIVVPDTRIGNAAFRRRAAHARSRGARNGRRSSAWRTVRATAWKTVRATAWRTVRATAGRYITAAGTASSAAAAGNASTASGTAIWCSSGGTAHTLIVHAHHHVSVAQRECRRTAGGEGEAQAGRSALAGGPRALVLQTVPLHAVASGVHDAAS